MNQVPPSNSSAPPSKVFRANIPAEGFGFRTGAWAVPPASTMPLPLRAQTTLDALAISAEDTALGIKLYGTEFLEGTAPAFLSYADLYAQAGRAAAVLKEKGVGRGDRILIVLPTSYAFFITFFACQWLGAIPVPSYPPAAMEKIETALDRLVHIANSAATKILVTVPELKPVIGDVLRRCKSLSHVLMADVLETAHEQPPSRGELEANDPCFIQYTSGSTGTQKGVLLTHSNITNNLHAIGMGTRMTRHDAFASWLPLYHDMGLIGGALCPIYWTLPMSLCAPNDFLMRPLLWLRMIEDAKATMTAAPNFAYGYVARRVEPEIISTMDLSSLRIAMSGAEPINADTVRTFREAMAPAGFKPESVFPAYGLAEASLAVCFAEPGVFHAEFSVDRQALAQGHVVERERGSEGATTLVCVGKPLSHHDVLLFDADGQEVGNDEVGHIVVSGPSVMAGYDKNLEATAKVLKDGYLWTGDLGFMRAEGLYVAGRVKDLIIVRGKNYYAEDIERCVEQNADVRPGGVVAFAVYDERAARDNVVIVAETRISDVDARASLANKLTECISDQFGLTVEEVSLVEPGTIPKTSSGKRQRSLTRERYLSGTLDKERAGALRVASVFMRSALGFLAVAKRSLTGRRVPEREET